MLCTNKLVKNIFYMLYYNFLLKCRKYDFNHNTMLLSRIKYIFIYSKGRSRSISHDPYTEKKKKK